MDIALWTKRFHTRINEDPEASTAWGYLTKTCLCDEQELEMLLHGIADSEEEVYGVMEHLFIKRRIDFLYMGKGFRSMLRCFPVLKHSPDPSLHAKVQAWERATIDLSDTLLRYAEAQPSNMMFIKFVIPLLVRYVWKRSNERYSYNHIAALVRCAKLDLDSGYTPDAVRKTVVKFRQHQSACWEAIVRAVDRRGLEKAPNLKETYFEELQRAGTKFPAHRPRLDLADPDAVERYLRRHGIYPPGRKPLSAQLSSSQK